MTKAAFKYAAPSALREQEKVKIKVRIQTLRRLSPQFPGGVASCLLPRSARQDSEENMRTPGFEPGPLTFFEQSFTFSVNAFAMCILPKQNASDIERSSMLRVPIWSEQKGSWKAKILARLYYIRTLICRYQTECPASARFNLEGIGFKKLIMACPVSSSLSSKAA